MNGFEKSSETPQRKLTLMKVRLCETEVSTANANEFLPRRGVMPLKCARARDEEPRGAVPGFSGLISPEFNWEPLVREIDPQTADGEVEHQTQTRERQKAASLLMT